MRYLSDRRPKVSGALEALHITTAQAHQMPYLSAASKEDLFALPATSLSSMTPEQLVRFAQIVDTALFKCYLLVRPGLLASLCRVGNWCEVSEVEQVLKEREVRLHAHLVSGVLIFSPEILGTYLPLQWQEDAREGTGSAQAVCASHTRASFSAYASNRLSENEADMRGRLMPSINYLQRLGPEYLDLIFEHSRWVFEQDVDIGFEVCLLISMTAIPVTKLCVRFSRRKRLSYPVHLSQISWSQSTLLYAHGSSSISSTRRETSRRYSTTA